MKNKTTKVYSTPIQLKLPVDLQRIIKINEPLMDGFHKRYGFYPQYPVADAGYGSFNNYLYCQQHGMEKYMKFTMYEKETKDSKYRDNPYRACNFDIDHEGYIAPRKVHFLGDVVVIPKLHTKSIPQVKCQVKNQRRIPFLESSVFRGLFFYSPFLKWLFSGQCPRTIRYGHRYCPFAIGHRTTLPAVQIVVHRCVMGRM